jgi:hypothetical protein
MWQLRRFRSRPDVLSSAGKLFRQELRVRSAPIPAHTLVLNWHLNYKGIKNPPVGKPYTNKRSPFDYFKTNILVDTMGFNAIGVRAAIEMCGVDRVVFGTGFGPVPYGIKEHVQIVEDISCRVA